MSKLDLNKDYWENRWKTQETGWDLGMISPPIQKYVDQISNKELKILIPGAGNAYEASYLFAMGFKNVFVVDIAKEPLEAFKSKHPTFPSENLIHRNFFDLSDRYELVIEQTFFCALDPILRKDYVDKMKEILVEKGKLAGLLFEDTLNTDKPPFGGNRVEYRQLFEKNFHILQMEITPDSVLPRAGRELLIEFQKK